MVNLADLPNAGALSGSETLPMQQGAGAVKVTVNFLFSRETGQFIPFDIGGTRVASVSNDGIFVNDGSANRARWARDGTIMAGKTTASSSDVGAELRPSGMILGVTNGASALYLNRFVSDGVIANFLRASTDVGSITVTGSSTSYNTSSDYRLPWKAGHVPLSGSGDFIDALKPRFFPVVGHAGFIAHEFAEASPSSVTGEKDATDEGGNPVYQQMDASSPDVMANVIAELQSLRRRVAALEAAA